MRSRQMHTFLAGKRFVDRLFLELVRNEVRDQVGDHQGNDDRIIACDLENHEHRRQRRTHDSGERGSHADQCIRAGTRCVAGEQRVGDASDRRAHHCADEQGRTKNAARVAGSIADCGRNDLEHSQQHDDFQNNVTVQHFFDVVVADP